MKYIKNWFKFFEAPHPRKIQFMISCVLCSKPMPEGNMLEHASEHKEELLKQRRMT